MAVWVCRLEREAPPRRQVGTGAYLKRGCGGEAFRHAFRMREREVRRGTTPCRVVLAYTVGRASGADALAFLGFALLTMHILGYRGAEVKSFLRDCGASHFLHICKKISLFFAAAKKSGLAFSLKRALPRRGALTGREMTELLGEGAEVGTHAPPADRAVVRVAQVALVICEVVIQPLESGVAVAEGDVFRLDRGCGVAVIEPRGVRPRGAPCWGEVRTLRGRCGRTRRTGL